GVAFWYAKRSDEAQKYLTQAHTADPTAAAPLFNLGKLAYLAEHQEEATRYWTAYLQQDPASPWAVAIRDTLQMPALHPSAAPSTTSQGEALAGVEVGMPPSVLATKWGLPSQTHTISLGKESFTRAVYPGGLLAV